MLYGFDRFTSHVNDCLLSYTVNSVCKHTEYANTGYHRTILEHQTPRLHTIAALQ